MCIHILLERLEIDGKDLRVKRNLHYDQRAAMRILGDLSEWGDTEGRSTGLRSITRLAQP